MVVVVEQSISIISTRCCSVNKQCCSGNIVLMLSLVFTFLDNHMMLINKYLFSRSDMRGAFVSLNLNIQNLQNLRCSYFLYFVLYFELVINLKFNTYLMLNDIVFAYRVLKALQKKPTFKKLTRTLDRLASDSITSNGMHKRESWDKAKTVVDVWIGLILVIRVFWIVVYSTEVWLSGYAAHAM